VDAGDGALPSWLLWLKQVGHFVFFSKKMVSFAFNKFRLVLTESSDETMAQMYLVQTKGQMLSALK